MNVNKMLLTVGAATLMAAAATPAQATWGCWLSKKCGSSGGSTSTGGSSSGGTPTPVPEPEQMALFGIGASVLIGRMVIATRKRK
jgi:hypothetical protein